MSRRVGVECRLSRSRVAPSKTAHVTDGEKNAPWFHILLQFGTERLPDVRAVARPNLCRQEGGPSRALTIQNPTLRKTSKIANSAQKAVDIQ